MTNREKVKNVTERVATLGVLTAVALVLTYVETVITMGIRLPGVKLGLCHLVTLFALYRMKTADVWLTGLVRVSLSALLFGNAMIFLYGGMGTLCSLAVMLLLRKCRYFSAVGVSVAGGAAHNIGQIICAALLLETGGLAWYLPFLLVAGTLSGVITGILGGMLIHRCPWPKYH